MAAILVEALICSGSVNIFIFTLHRPTSFTRKDSIVVCMKASKEGPECLGGFSVLFFNCDRPM